MHGLATKLTTRCFGRDWAGEEASECGKGSSSRARSACRSGRWRRFDTSASASDWSASWKYCFDQVHITKPGCGWNQFNEVLRSWEGKHLESILGGGGNVANELFMGISFLILNRELKDMYTRNLEKSSGVKFDQISYMSSGEMTLQSWERKKSGRKNTFIYSPVHKNILARFVHMFKASIKVQSGAVLQVDQC